MENEGPTEKKSDNSSPAENSLGDTPNHQMDEEQVPSEMKSLNITEENPDVHHEKEQKNMNIQIVESEGQEERKQTIEEILGEEQEAEPVFDGTETPDMEAIRNSYDHSLDLDPETQTNAWPEKAVALKNFVKEKGSFAVSSVLRRLSGKKDEDGQTIFYGEEKNENSTGIVTEEEDSTPGSKPTEASPKTGERSTWNPLSYIKIAPRDVDIENKAEQAEIVSIEDSAKQPAMKGRVILYTRLGCQECRGVRSFLHQKRLKFVEINIDIYPSRKLELEKKTGSSAVPKVFFNDLLIVGLSELKAMDDTGKLDEKINDLINEQPSPEAPFPPLSGEDDMSGTGMVDELAIIVRKLKESVVVEDRFYKMRRFANCFVGSEAVDFLAEDQYLEREEAVEFGRKLATKYFFQHVLNENVFEDGNHLYRFLDHDPIVLSQCYNMPRGIIDVKPKPIVEIASRLRFLLFAMFEAYVSDNGRHVDYRSIQSSEEFARYFRIVEELQRVELDGLSREEKLAFFINLYNMMAIHAILLWGYPVGAIDRRKFFGDFKYVVGGSTYSLSAIRNGILRGNQRPPYNLMKPFALRDQRSKVALPYPEPLIHFALVCGTRSGPALRCYSPGNIDKELMEAARDFMRNGGLVVDTETKVASVSKILRWYSADFGKNETEVMKHAANYLEASKSEELLELLAHTQLKVIYQPYDWSLNC
ncbi:electron carrier/ protein disulfide oxidoreductase [Tasmannia lanceolata]|uniref:electron carrier/ protein disulfide oxidoreductase n=1 Tax=Tasmannia lanceolata TaxID=3420 RepID=UPI00406420A7